MNIAEGMGNAVYNKEAMKKLQHPCRAVVAAVCLDCRCGQESPTVRQVGKSQPLSAPFRGTKGKAG